MTKIRTRSTGRRHPEGSGSDPGDLLAPAGGSLPSRKSPGRLKFVQLLRRGAAVVCVALSLGGCADRDLPRERGGEARAEKGVGAAADTIPLAERRGIAGRIVFVSERDGNAEVYSILPSGEGLRRLTRDPRADFPGPPAPDGRTLVVVSVREEGGGHVEQLGLLPLDGGALQPLGPASARARSPSWGPDGSWLAFESDRASFRDVFRVGRDGGGLRRLTEDAAGSFEPEVSPDGAWIAFASSRDGDAEVYVMRADGSDERRLTAFHRDDWAPRWAPDGRTLAFLSAREGADRVFLVGSDGTGLRKLSAAGDTGAARADRQEADPAWSPEGARVAHTLRTRDGGSRIRVADIATGAVREVAGAAKAQQPAWSPDGRYLAFTADADGDPELWIARADGSGATRLTRSPGPDWLPRWVP
ncbi:MAG TPA: hypothetical protein VF746_16725 [Longimicrobium sp.]